MVAKTYNNNIFAIITNLDKKNYNFFSGYNEAQYNELQPYTLLRWLSACQNESKDSEDYIKKTNIINDLIFRLNPDNKNLLLNLLCSIGSGHWIKHAWIAPPKGSKVSKDEEEYKNFYHYNDDEWNMKKKLLTKDDYKELDKYLGRADKG